MAEYCELRRGHLVQVIDRSDPYFARVGRIVGKERGRESWRVQFPRDAAPCALPDANLCRVDKDPDGG